MAAAQAAFRAGKDGPTTATAANTTADDCAAAIAASTAHANFGTQLSEK